MYFGSLIPFSLRDIAAHHDIKPTIERFELSEEGLAKAVDRLQKGTLRYRGVLVTR